ncbi:Phage integrase [Plesiocystis pacifica SIR-1]|uniref:Phage integrase n=1 Tax=Plesiocystis pacifica SIR-1 TaxID=391625 RepID=A6GBQ8_9BACT|nr:tyrosine-type recombinase/integrase [Plesiocystis pacifica]EDM76675.1 Phage integrase [Plesiocystis pacifica SIR-1]
MSVYKKRWTGKDGRVRTKWMVHIKHTGPDGKRKEIRRVSPVNTRRGAEAFERELRDKLLPGARGKDKRTQHIRSAPTLEDFAPEFLAFQASPGASRKGPNKPGELREKRRTLDNHLIPAFGELRLDEIRARDIDRYITRKHADGLSTSTISNHLIVLKRLLNVARRWELLDRIPEIPTPKKPARTDFLSKDEARALLVGAEEQWRSLVLLGLRTGLRLGELRGLRWRDVDLEGGQVRVEQAVTNAGIGTPKSGKGRSVPLARDIREALAVRRGPRRRKPDTLVFAQSDGRPLAHNTIGRALTRAAEAAGIERRITPHVLRHTFASHAVLAGVPIRIVQGWLGHADITMTMRYAHLSPEGHGGMIDRLLD